ncbi:unnamed protein product [Arctia plantaginis]|uniref:Peptidase S1 domain-containing protein n=1 Tax=Arctia plantaginis TaxID=874455 RepID=A0A8S0Z6I5_ARCPL|nr:unnamed protein product [Arctia plantaginis]CAB3228225.1 unnamed protein product [Arctia plantaginis]
MDYKTGLLLVTLLVGCFALPTPENGSLFRVDPRIVGGTVAAPGSHPHMAALTRGLLIRSFVCGGSIISPRTILTAAHCIINNIDRNGGITGNMRVTVGTNRWNRGGTELHLTRGVMHPEYNHNTIKNDVAVLIASINIQYSSLVQPASLSYAFINENLPVRAAGWGAVRAFGPAQDELLEVDLTSLTPQQCEDDMRTFVIQNNIRSPPALDTGIEICTFHGPGLGVCQGDSGSALRRIDNRQQIGVVSWGFPCARGAPDVYARVSSFEIFITSNTLG